MSVFSLLKRGRQAAKEHRAEKAAKDKKEAEKPPYKHIPKHAATDALSGGPAGWREHDRQKIVEHNKRRSALTASGMGMSGVSGMPRVQSSLSHVSYPTSYVNPIVHVPRTYSYSSMPVGWTHHGREMSYSPVDMGHMSLKGKEVERIMGVSSHTSRSSSKASIGRTPLPIGDTLRNGDVAVSPVESSSTSNSSQDDLEMKPTKHCASIPPPISGVRPRPTGDIETVHRLHPGHSRRVSDPNHSAVPPRNLYAQRTSFLAAGIPPVPALPPMQFGTAVTTSAVSSTAGSSASSVTMVPIASSASLAATFLAAKPVPTALKVEAEAAVVQVSSDEDASPVTRLGKAPAIAPHATAEFRPKNARSVSRITRFTELETIKSDATATIAAKPPSPLSIATGLPTDFDEASLTQPKEVVLSQVQSLPKPGKLSKLSSATPKLVKKKRWSLRSSKSAAVAAN
ncbi:hypothetical protein BT67DRAFT_497416 [Trichocladium antarcticum]|uniref:Uncharacterized protein n=1 Tax=Trichocladium antarcticum TaxID=1450529 RepID=A0AAN6ZCU4_9PEZI|nr:hypothetical protein BT67DRAFT_497416 [Trichocladium antarcticum]